MAVTVAELDGNRRSWACVTKTLDFTSTTATAEVPVGMTEIYDWSWARIGDAAADNTGTLTLDETWSDGVVAVDADGEVTVDRAAITATGTLGSETFVVTFWGKS